MFAGTYKARPVVEMEASLEQAYAIEFCVRLQKSASETFDMIREAMSSTSIFRWDKAFGEGRQKVKDIEHERRLSTFITEAMINTAAIIIKEYRRIAVRQLHAFLNISVGSVHSIMAEHLQLKRV
ncbi:HTH_48 domain-containing protein [Trichonephila clavata]|uniref:HTH_48 domain-containing protein n=1 Tax=Trichonephila clavata TaxID=2740835 RepID=A0A8X6FI03_TRICU|nr:HTH_48 domain-containing protein [Trichonephila clavata]